MSKQSIALLFRNYIWLADTIYSARRITREEINQKWSRSTLAQDFGSKEIQERTFHNWRHDIEYLFQINICCDRKTGEYYIENADDMQEGGIRTWLINTFAVQSLIDDSQHIRKQILFESIPSGRRFLTPLIEAMRDRLQVRISYQRFDSAEPHVFMAKPYCVKVFAQRWYLLAKPDYRKELRIYALDRVHSVEITDKPYKLPANFDAEQYFRDTYGVSGMGEKIENIEIKVNSWQSNFLRTLPLHESQREVEQTDEYSVFRFTLVPSFEFVMELQKLGTSVEVLSPDYLRQQFREKALELVEMYK